MIERAAEERDYIVLLAVRKTSNGDVFGRDGSTGFSVSLLASIVAVTRRGDTQGAVLAT
jgi:hypothetical protein